MHARLRAPATTDAIAGHAADFFDGGSVLVERWRRHWDWFHERARNGQDFSCRSLADPVGPVGQVHLRSGHILRGINFGSRDHLNLAADPRLRAAAGIALDRYGMHCGATVSEAGNSPPGLLLEQRLAAFLGYADCTIFPNEWSACYGALRLLVRREDHVLIDAEAPRVFLEAALAATPNVQRLPHASIAALATRVKGLRRVYHRAGILVVTATCFPRTGKVPDLREAQDLCRRYDATLLAYADRDLGTIGQGGRGCLEEQDYLGGIDLLVGNLAGVFGAPGGFLACNNPALKLALQLYSGPLADAAAISPVQASIILAALAIVDSAEGQARRERLRGNILRARTALANHGFRPGARPMPTLTLELGDVAYARAATLFAHDAGVILTLDEPIHAGQGPACWRAELMADHTEAQIDCLAEVAGEAKARRHRLGDANDSLSL